MNWFYKVKQKFRVWYDWIFKAEENRPEVANERLYEL